MNDIGWGNTPNPKWQLVETEESKHRKLKRFKDHDGEFQGLADEGLGKRLAPWS